MCALLVLPQPEQAAAELAAKGKGAKRKADGEAEGAGEAGAKKGK